MGAKSSPYTPKATAYTTFVKHWHPVIKKENADKSHREIMALLVLMWREHKHQLLIELSSL